MDNITIEDGGTVGDGGGISNIGTLAVTNSTLSGNSANPSDGEGGGIFNAGTATLKATIVAASPGGGNCSGGISDDGYNISSDNSCGFSATGSKSDYSGSLLSSAGLADNGGPTETIALETGSYAIDAISLADCPATDQRSYTRPDEGESDCDIGAYESGATATGAKFQIDTSTGSFDLKSNLTFAGAVDPVTQNVTLQIGSYSVTIPAGSFVETKKGDYVFQGTIGAVSLQVRLLPQSDGSYTLQLEGSNADLSGATNPLAVALTMTDANGNLLATGGISAIASTN